MGLLSIRFGMWDWRELPNLFAANGGPGHAGIWGSRQALEKDGFVRWSRILVTYAGLSIDPAGMGHVLGSDGFDRSGQAPWPSLRGRSGPVRPGAFPPPRSVQVRPR